MDMDSHNRHILHMMTLRSVFSIFILIVLISSCNKEEVIETTPPPVIILDSLQGIYMVKQSKPLLIAPEYKHVQDATYSWVCGSEQLSNKPTCEFMSDSLGTFFITITVTTKYGTASEEIKVEVVEKEIPEVSLAGADKGFIILKSTGLRLTPSVRETSLPVTYLWKVEGKEVSDSLSYTFSSDEEKEYQLSFKAENEDGSSQIEFSIKVCSKENMPLMWKFEKDIFNYSTGRSIKISPIEIYNAEGATFCWLKDSDTLHKDTLPEWICSIKEEGKHIVTAVANVEKEGSVVTLTQELTINVCPPEGTYFRASGAASDSSWNKVYEYTPAPGQFINEMKTGGFDGTQTTPEAAIQYAENRLSQGTYVSLGGFGGYIIVGFDHSIENRSDYDFAIEGNSFDGSSEPGIVWVMQDENGDGLPNDTWYELRGSETGNPQTIQDYAVTYYRPSAPAMPVQWTDNLGGSGEIDYLKQFHKQDYYYPLWIEEDSYTLRGTRLEARNYDKSGNGSYWVNPSYEWGYVDNFSPIDRLTEDDNYGAAKNANHFKISNAMDYAGNPINLKYIDFIKVQCALNTKSGWLGEASTEVFGFYEYKK